MASDENKPFLKLLTEAEAAGLLRLSERTLRQIRADGGISYLQISKRRIAYREEDLLAYLDRASRPAVERTQARPAPAPKLIRRAVTKADGILDLYVERARAKMRQQ